MLGTFRPSLRIQCDYISKIRRMSTYGEAYSSSAQAIGRISRGEFNKDDIDSHLAWKAPNASYVGISGTLCAYATALHVKNQMATDYLKSLIPEGYTAESYYNEWKRYA